MELKKINILNYKSIKNVTLDFNKFGNSNTQILVGINESGKSSILEAINLINGNLEILGYNEFCNFDMQDEDEYVEVFYHFEIDDFENNEWKKIVSSNEEIKDIYKNIDKININEIVYNIYKNFSTGYDKHIKIDFKYTDFPYYKYFVTEVNKIINGTSIIVKNIKEIKDPNNSKTLITKANYKEFLTENQKPLTYGDLDARLDFILENYFLNLLPKFQIWKPKSEFLINEKIDLNTFKVNPNSCIPLKNIFYIYGKKDEESIRKSIDRALTTQAKTDELKEKLSESITRYINKVWKEHKIKIKISINGNSCSVHVEDNDKKFSYFSMSQRSDGFKHFISLILSLSAQNSIDGLKNNIILIDEPEVHLHPSGIKYMRDELLKIGENNKVIISTHSSFMIDTENPERHWIVKKEKAETTINQLNSEYNFTDDKVLSVAFGLNLFKELLPQNIIVVEGGDDKSTISHILVKIKEKFVYSMKSAGGASKVPGFARLLNDEKVQSFIIFDDDKEGRDFKKKILDEQKNFYSSNNVKTLKDIVPSLPSDSTLEDLFPSDFVNNFFNSELEKNFTIDPTKAILPQLKIQDERLKDKQKLDSLKLKLSENFCKEYNTKSKLESLPKIKEFAENMISFIEANKN